MSEIFDKVARERIRRAIEAAELNTSGEIHVHVSKRCGTDPVDAAVRTFNILGMHKTELRNGVLFYFATTDRRFAVIGDKGINDIVKQGFWDDIVSTIKSAFAAGTPIDGICASIALCGEKLREHFPHQSDDVNELSDIVTDDETETTDAAVSNAAKHENA